MLFAVLTLGLVVAGCSSSGQAISTVDANKFSEVVQTAGTQVIDVRTPAEFAAGHLQGATNIDVESATFADQIAALDRTGTYAVYCRSGNRSRTATQQMADAGFSTLYDLDGGLTAWTAAGLPVVQ
jgi:phage shock protein E